MSQVLQLGPGERAFGSFQGELPCKQELERCFEVTHMVRHGFTIDQHIIEEDDDESAQTGPKELINSCLKG